MSRRRRGRPSKLSAVVQSRLVDALREGVPYAVAAAVAGIGASTFYAWMSRGRDEEGGDFRDFLEAVEGAQAEAEVSCLRMIRNAAARDWRAAAWILERRFPERWARREAEDRENFGDPLDEIVRRLREAASSAEGEGKP